MNSSKNNSLLSGLRPLVRSAAVVLAAVAVIWWCPNAQAQINVVDKPSAVTSASGLNISAPVTVSSGANVLVVLLATESSGGTYSDPTTLSWNGQTLTQAVTASDNTSTYRNATIYYLFTPPPGTANVTATAVTTKGWVLQSYTLSGVDTNTAPVTGSGANKTGGVSIGVTCPNNGAAALCANWSSSAPITIAITATNSLGAGITANVTNVYESNIGGTPGLGYVLGLTPAGTDTFTATPSTANKSVFVAAVFAPLVTATAPIVISPTKSSIGASTATLGATVGDDGGATITDYGVVWGTSTNPTTANNKISAGSSPSIGNPYTVSATGLPSSTAIHYRGYAVNSRGTGYSADDSFSTSATQPTIQASACGFSNVGDTAVTVSWTRGNGTYSIVLVSAGSPVNSDPVGGVTYNANAVFGNGDQIGSGNYVAYLGTGNSFTLRGLSPSSTNYVSVYALNGFGGGENYLTPGATGNATTATHISSTTYYSGAATGDPTSVFSWWTGTNGTGYNPPNFTSGDTFIIQSGHSYASTSPVNSNWQVDASTGGTAATVQINSGGTLTLGNSTANQNLNLNLGGNFVQNGTLSVVNGPTMTFTSNGTWTGSGDLSGDKMNLTVNAGATLTASGMNAPGFKFYNSSRQIYVNGTLDMGARTINGNGGATLQFRSGSTLITAHPGGVGGINNNPATGTLFGFNTLTQVTFDPTTSFVFNGTNAQDTGTGLPATVNNLTISNSTGVTLDQATAVAGALTLSSGALITTTNNLLTVGSGGTSGTISGGSPSAYVSGPLAQVYSTASALSFPVGLNGNYRAVTVNLATQPAPPSTITVTPHEPGVFGGTAPGGQSVWSTRDWNIADSTASGDVANITVDGTDYSPAGAASLLDYDGTSTTALTTSYLTPNYSSLGINLTASSDIALGCSAPPVPAIASITALSCSPVTVKWTASSGAAYYNVYRKLSSGSYGSPLMVGVTATNYSDSTGISGTSYIYAVTAVSQCGTESALSSDSSAVTPTGAPVPPTISGVTPGCGAVAVNWGAVSGATGGYNIYRKLSGGSYGASIAHVSTGTLTYPDNSANDPTKTYVYAVSAVAACESVLSPDSSGASPTNVGFTSNPANTAGYEGFPATFSVTALNASSYKWQVNKGGGFADAIEAVDGTGSTTATFTTASATTAMNGYLYHCVVTGGCGPTTSGNATLSLGTQFRSIATGYWTNNASWQLSSDGVNWSSTAVGVYPGATAGHADAVEVQAGNIITISDLGTNNVGNLTIDAGSTAGGTVMLGDAASATATLQISGNLAINTGAVNGSLTPPIGSPQLYLLEFNGNSTWSGVGDISAARVGIKVDPNSTLTLACDVRLYNTTSDMLGTISGRLNAGARRILAQGSKTTKMNVTAGATVETANTGGLGGLFASTGTFQGPDNTTFSANASYVFDGASSQSALGSGSTSAFTGATNLTINNSGGAGNNVVAVGAIGVGGTLYIQSGLLSFGSDTNSTANLLTFDGSTYQLPGTWGSSSSAATHQDNAHFAGTGLVTVVGGAVTPLPVGSLNISGASIAYSGGAGMQFVLLSSTNLANPLSSWNRVATNPASSGTFTIPAVVSSPLKFYSIKSE